MQLIVKTLKAKYSMPSKTDKTSNDNAQTGWVIAATEGSTVDGRTITKNWIEEMAATYSVDEYTAVIWPEHFRSTWGPFDGKNWGTVDDVKKGMQGGKLRLFVKLTANSYLLDANKDGQKLFMSIEPNTDFKGTGKCYLQGLAVTDSPASTGTTRLKFSMGESEIEHDYSALEALNTSDFIFTSSHENTANENANQDISKEAKAKSLFTQLLQLFSTPLTTNQASDATDNAEDETMKQEQFDALMGNINGVTKKVETLETNFGNLEKQVQTFKKEEAADEGSDDKGADTDKDADAGKDKKTSSVTDEQFSQLTKSITGLTGKIEGIETKFNKLNQEIDGQEPDASGKDDKVSLI